MENIKILKGLTSMSHCLRGLFLNTGQTPLDSHPETITILISDWRCLGRRSLPCHSLGSEETPQSLKQVKQHSIYLSVHPSIHPFIHSTKLIKHLCDSKTPCVCGNTKQETECQPQKGHSPGQLGKMPMCSDRKGRVELETDDSTMGKDPWVKREQKA